jgi:purine nucleoside permease
VSSGSIEPDLQLEEAAAGRRSAAESLTATSLTQNPGYLPALDAAYLVGRKVVDEIIENWAVYGDTNPIVPSGS